MQHRIKTHPRVRPSLLGWLVIALVMLVFSQFASAQGVLTYTNATSSSNGNITTVLTWSTAPAASSCIASGDPAWTGNKGASGTATLPAVAPPRAYTLRCTWPGDSIATVSWQAPTTNTDGTALTNLAGYRLVYGTSPSTLSTSVPINNPATLTRQVTGLAPGSWTFGVYAVNSVGVESELSNLASKVIQAPFEVTQTISIKRPNPAVITGVE